MPLFRYQAYDREGLEVAGVLDADDLLMARQAIKARGLAPFLIEPASDDSGSSFGAGNFSLSEQARLARQLAALLKGGVSLTKALSGIENQQAWAHRRNSLVALREGIEKGRDLSGVLGEMKNIFAASLLSVIRVGETTGRLDFAFAQLSTHLEREREHRRRLTAAIAYPAITAIISVGVLAFLMVYLVPVVARMFADVQGDLPWITRWLIASSNFFTAWWLVIALSMLAMLAIFRLAMHFPANRRNFEKLQLKLPIWGQFIEGMRMEAWARSTGMLIQCGVTLLESVRVIRENETSILQSEALLEVEKSLERGVSFSEALKTSGSFPVFVIQMIEAGETSGELAPMLFSAAGELEAENRSATELFLTILEPALIVIMGTAVGAIMVGVLLPIYEMNRFM
ncbi:MAG TPA: type II secretion system F family protein [Candidatus Rifleibacterium sp.]|nr:type II secretion system F family protein [Candidatus Rifleibacterium sp.]